MRLTITMLALAAFMAGCGASESADDTPPPAPPEAHGWVLCDGLDAPRIVVINDMGAAGVVSLKIFDKNSGAYDGAHALTRGAPSTIDGVVETPLARDGVAFGAVIAMAPEALADPSGAYTDPVMRVRAGALDLRCRWLERTRLAAFTTRRSLVVSEDDDGDLIYRVFDFADADEAAPIALDSAQWSSRFSLEVRGGAEESGPEGAIYRFSNDGTDYAVTLSETGEGALIVSRGGAEVQREPLIAALTPPMNE